MTGKVSLCGEAPSSDWLPGEEFASFCSHLGAMRTITAITR